MLAMQIPQPAFPHMVQSSEALCKNKTHGIAILLVLINWVMSSLTSQRQEKPVTTVMATKDYRKPHPFQKALVKLQPKSNVGMTNQICTLCRLHMLLWSSKHITLCLTDVVIRIMIVFLGWLQYDETFHPSLRDVACETRIYIQTGWGCLPSVATQSTR